MRAGLRSCSVLICLFLGVAVVSPSEAVLAAAGSPTKSPRAAVKILVGRFGKPRMYLCTIPYNKQKACPVTGALRKRLHYLTRFQADPVCRCQQGPVSLKIHMARMTATGATVSTRWGYGPKDSFTLVWVVRHVSGGWLVADSFCQGKPKTSLFKKDGPCP
jgi:hypothetical protein